jgi:hypothetical protein
MKWRDIMHKILPLLVILFVNFECASIQYVHALEKDEKGFAIISEAKEANELEKRSRSPLKIVFKKFDSPFSLAIYDSQLFSEHQFLAINGSGNELQEDLKPPLTISKFLLSFGSGACVGGILGGIGGLLGYYAFGENDQDNVAGTTGFIIGGAIGYVTGSSLGVYLFGNIGNQTGSYKVTLLSSLLGAAVGGIGLYLSERVFADPNYGGNDELSAVVACIGSPLAATIGFSMTRRYQSPASAEAALVNIKNGQVIITIPRISVNSCANDRDRFMKSVSLVNICF